MTVTVPTVVVSPPRFSVTPGIALEIVSEAELPATPLTVYWALVPCCARAVCSVSELAVSDTWMKFVPVSPVARLERTTVPESVAVAQWAGTYLPKDSRVAADSTFIRLLPNFAPVTTITQPAGFDSMTPLFIAHSVDHFVSIDAFNAYPQQIVAAVLTEVCRGCLDITAFAAKVGAEPGCPRGGG